MNDEQRTISYLNIEISDENVREHTGGGGALGVARSEIKKAVLRHGRSSEKPGLSLTMGAIFIAVGLLPVKGIINWMTDGGTLHFVHVVMLALVVLGAWLIFWTLKKNYYLRVETQANRWNLVFRGKVLIDDLKSFVDEANTEYGYTIESEI